MVTLNTVKEIGLATASTLGGAASLVLNNPIGAAVHAIVETNQYLKKSFQSPLLRAVVAAGVGAAAYLQPRAVTAILIASSALKFGAQALNADSSNLNSTSSPRQIDYSAPVEERGFVLASDESRGDSKNNPIEILDDVLTDKDKAVISRYNKKTAPVNYMGMVTLVKEEITPFKTN